MPFIPDDQQRFIPDDFQPDQQKSGFLGLIGGLLKKRFITPFTQPVPRFSSKQEAIEAGSKEALGTALGVINPEGGAIATGEAKIANLAKPLLESAQKSVARLFKPTTKAAKQLTEKITPGFLEKAPSYFTRSGLQRVAESQFKTIGEKIGEAVEKLPLAQHDTSPIIKALEDVKQQYIVKGSNVVANTAAYSNINAIQDLIKQFGGQISTESLRSLRQILDASVTAGDKAFGRTLAEGTRLDAEREGANAIRREFAKKYPNIARLNAEYSFWKNVDKVISGTLERTKSQIGGLSRVAGQAAGEVVGSAAGGIPGAVAGGFIGNKFAQLIDSAAWHRLSIFSKRKAADLIIRGHADKALKLIEKGIISLQGRGVTKVSQ